MKEKKQETKRITFDVPVELHMALKIAATTENMSIKMYLLDPILKKLKKAGHIKIVNQ